MAGHILGLQRERPAHTTMYWVAEDCRRKREGRRRHGEVLSKNTCKRWLSAGTEPAGSPVTVRDGDFQSPDALRATCGPRYK